MVKIQTPFVARMAAAGFASVFALTLGAAAADAQTSTTRQNTTTTTTTQQRAAPSATAGGASTAGSNQQGSGEQMSRTGVGAASAPSSPTPQPGGSLSANPANLGTTPGVISTTSRPGEGVYTPQTTPADRTGVGTRPVGAGGSPATSSGERTQGSGGGVSPTAAGPQGIQTAPGAVSGTATGASVPATAMNPSVPGSAAPAPGGNKDAYLTYHRAIESVRLCEGRSFNQDQAERMSEVIDRVAGTRAFGAGNMLMMIRQAREEAFRFVEVEGCQGPKIMASRQLYAKELAPVIK